MKVTFDSNVWEKLVRGEDSFHTVRDKILAGEIEPYICEIAVSLESVKRKDRFQFWKSYAPNFEPIDLPSNDDSIAVEIGLSPNNEAHPGLHPKQKECLGIAKELGFKVLTMTNVGTVRSPEIPQEMKINFTETDRFWHYAERLGECSKFIESLGSGAAEYRRLKEVYGFNNLSVFQMAREIRPEQEKKFRDAISEWVDGDSLSAHYAYGNDVFCTEDQGKNSGGSSVFHHINLEKVKAKFGLTVLRGCELEKL